MNRSLFLCSGSETVGGKSSLWELRFRPSSWFRLGFSLPDVLTSLMTQAMPDEGERRRKGFKVSFTMTMWSPAQRCEERTDIDESSLSPKLYILNDTEYVSEGDTLLWLFYAKH